MKRPVLGIDIAKSSYAGVLLYAEQQQHRSFPNRAQAFGELSAWLEEYSIQQIHMK